MIIDMHTHTFPDAIAEKTLKKLSALSHTMPFTAGTAGALLASMRETGVDCSVILPVATAPRQVSHINEASARLNEEQGMYGLLSFGCIHPDCPDWKEELTRAAALGLKGIKIHPVYQGVDLDDPRYLRILERAGELNLIVVTHAGMDVGFPGQVRCSPAMALRAVQQAGPVRLVLAHMGGWRNWDEVEELLSQAPVYLDTSFSTGEMTPLDDGYYTSEDLPLMGERQFVRMVRTFGAERILFGTDSPWSGQRESLTWIRDTALSADELEAILGANAQKLLGLTGGRSFPAILGHPAETAG